MRLPGRSNREPLEVKMTPMIDVVFLLLVFFVWTSSFEEPEFDLPSALAEVPDSGSVENVSEPATVEPFEEIIVKISRADQLKVIEMSGRQFRDVGDFDRAIREVLELGVQPPVIIDPEKTVTMDWAIKVYDIARAAGADRVLFATE
ncbi:MAG: biopolymer transporter ExbD [Planctomycetota bacterium]